MAWPVSGRYQNFVSNATPITSDFLHAVQDATVGIYGNTQSLVGLAVDAVGGASVAAVPGQVKATGGTQIAGLFTTTGTNKAAVQALAANGDGVQGQGGTNGNGVTGISSGTGAGLKGTDDGSTIGGAAIEALATGTQNPLFRAKNQDAHNRFAIDHQGYRFGRVNEWIWNWDTGDGNVAFGAATISSTAGAQSALTDKRLAALFGQWFLSSSGTVGELHTYGLSQAIGCQMGGILAPQTAAGDYVRLATANPILANMPNLDAAIEFEAHADQYPSHVQIAVGISGNQGDVGTGGDFAGFIMETGNLAGSVWRAEVWQGTLRKGQIVSAQTPVGGTFDFFRIELFGNGTPSGTLARFILNGTVLGTIAFLPSNDLHFDVAISGNTSAISSPTNLRLGQLRACWARGLNPALP